MLHVTRWVQPDFCTDFCCSHTHTHLTGGHNRSE